jgi:hypothetical protein
MFFWWLVVGILVASIVLLTLLLAPLPTFLVSAAVQLLNYIQRPLWLVLVLISWVLVGTPPPPQQSNLHSARVWVYKILFNNQLIALIDRWGGGVIRCIARNEEVL